MIMVGKRGPPPSATIPAMVEVLKASEKPVMTVADIAGELDVSNETVRRKREKLESHPDVQVAKVGRTTAYWVEDETPKAVTSTTPPQDEEKKSEEEAEQQSQNSGFLGRFFSLDTEGEQLPSVALLLLAVALPLVVLHRATGRGLARLTAGVEAYAEHSDEVRLARFGSPLNEWLLTVSVGMFFGVVAVAVSIVLFNPSVQMATQLVSALLGVTAFIFGSLAFHVWNTAPAVREETEA